MNCHWGGTAGRSESGGAPRVSKSKIVRRHEVCLRELGRENIRFEYRAGDHSPFP